ncbi:MAG: septal ring lytic transglycosylase RlpA family protein, partial [Geminicoccales bacterium]
MSARSPRWPLPGLILVALLGLGGCSSRAPETGGTYKLGDPYQVGGQWYYPESDPHYDRTGVASWYGAQFDGKATANGEVFDRHALSAAHPTLPLPSIVRVTNLANHRQLELRVNDRG